MVKRIGSIAVTAVATAMSMTCVAGVAHAQDTQLGTSENAATQPGVDTETQDRVVITPPVVSTDEEQQTQPGTANAGQGSVPSAAQPGTESATETAPQETAVTQPGTADSERESAPSAAQPGTESATETAPQETAVTQPGTAADTERESAPSAAQRPANTNATAGAIGNVSVPDEPATTTVENAEPARPQQTLVEAASEEETVTFPRSEATESASTESEESDTTEDDTEDSGSSAAEQDTGETHAEESATVAAAQAAVQDVPPAQAPAEPLGVAGAELSVTAPGIEVTAGGTSSPVAGDVAVSVGAGTQSVSVTTEYGGVDVAGPAGEFTVSEQDVQATQAAADAAFNALPEPVQNAAHGANRAVLDQAANLPEISSWGNGGIQATLTVDHW